MANVAPPTIEGGHLRNETLELLPGRLGHRFIGGVVLEDCRVIVRCPAKYWLIGDSTWINCAIEMKVRQKNQWWLQANLSGCSFTGTIVGGCFGRNPNADIWPQTAGMANCDFTRSNLHLCTFDNVDIETMKWPTWPNFVVPYQAVERLVKHQWPPEAWKFKVWVDVVGMMPSFGTSVYNAEMLLKDRDHPMSLDDFKAALDEIGGILY